MRRQFKWTNNQINKLNRIIEILNELKEYWPLTLRQVYYQLVGKGFIENTVSQYTMLSGLIKHARIDDYIPWDTIEDRVRMFNDLTGWSDSREFIKNHLDYFLKGYKRDLLQTQDKYIEIWIEKDALSSIFIKTAASYTVPVVVCRGFSSVSFLNDFKQRIENRPGKEIVMLYFGDFDPSGVEMLESMKITLQDEMGIDDIEYKRIALQRDDIFKYKLPHNPNAIKKGDTRSRKHVEAYGELAVELDALRPDILIEKIKSSIESELDLELFDKEIERQESEFDKLNKIKKSVSDFVSNLRD